MQPVTISRRHDPPFLYWAISRIASIDSCFAESMNAHVLTTRTSAPSGSRVSSCPASCARPSITSESTRFLGHPRETRPIFICLEVYNCRMRRQAALIVGVLTLAAAPALAQRSASLLDRFFAPDAQPLISYRAFRHLSASTLGGKMTASMDAWTSLDPQRGFTFDIVKMDGSSVIQKHVLL